MIILKTKHILACNLNTDHILFVAYIALISGWVKLIFTFKYTDLFFIFSFLHYCYKMHEKCFESFSFSVFFVIKKEFNNAI